MKWLKDYLKPIGLILFTFIGLPIIAMFTIMPLFFAVGDFLSPLFNKDKPNYNTEYVYVTEHGTKYHNEDCFYIDDGYYKRYDIDEAENQGYERCSKCW